MDGVKETSSTTAYYLGMIVPAFILLIAVIGIVLYVACSKKYKLNWFEKTVLENEESIEMKRYEITPCIL
jgi:hypothetical protein